MPRSVIKKEIIKEEMPEAKFILSKKKVIEQYQKIKKICDFVFYSLKTNFEVGQILEKETDCFFTVHLFEELKYLKDKKRVFFLGQGWSKEDLQKITALGVRWFGVDNLRDLTTFLDFLKEKPLSLNLLLRLKLKEHSLKTERYFVFGLESKILNKKIKELRKNQKIKILGIHFHRKTQNLSEWNLKDDLFPIIEEENWPRIDVINIGGGFPCSYANLEAEKNLPFIFQKIKKFRSWLKEKRIKLITEPGRFIAAPSIKLITQIINIEKEVITLNTSVYQTNLDALIVPQKLLVEGELKKGEGKPYLIKGKTPCPLDLFRYRVYLKNPQIGDTLIFLKAGAYNFTTDFCGLKKLKTEIRESF